jgi:hypothetical protein
MPSWQVGKHNDKNIAMFQLEYLCEGWEGTGSSDIDKGEGGVSTSPIATKTILSKTLKLQRNVMQF